MFLGNPHCELDSTILKKSCMFSPLKITPPPPLLIFRVQSHHNNLYSHNRLRIKKEISQACRMGLNRFRPDQVRSDSPGPGQWTWPSRPQQSNPTVTKQQSRPPGEPVGRRARSLREMPWSKY